MKKILIIGQAPPAVQQTVPYDTTLLYDMLGWVGITKEQAQDMFIFEACTDKFPGHGDDGGHKVPTEEDFKAHLEKTLWNKILQADKIILLGKVAFDRVVGNPRTNIECAFKHVLSLIHPSKRNYHRIMKERPEITRKLTWLLDAKSPTAL